MAEGGGGKLARAMGTVIGAILTAFFILVLLMLCIAVLRSLSDLLNLGVHVIHVIAP